jgi:hypothetical protein
MNLPFTIDEFLAVFASYNAANRPVLIVAYGLTIVALAAALADKVIVKGGR